MTRENLLFAIIGVLAGFIIGFMFASGMAQRQPPSSSAASSQNLPADHPPVSGAGGGDPQQTFADVQASMKKAREEPQNFEAQVNAARLEYQIQRFDEAIGFLLKANQLKPDDYETIANLGMVNLDANHFDQSIKWYKVALMKKPDDVTVVDGLCAAALGAGDAKEAETCIASLEKLDPQNVDLKQFKDKLSTLKAK